jgi:hypothetical protein
MDAKVVAGYFTKKSNIDLEALNKTKGRDL